MAKKKKKARNPHLRRRKYLWKNPWLPGTGKELLELAGGAAAGGLAARMIPENIPQLTARNTGVVGYGMNIVSGYVAAKALGYALGVKVEEGALAGTVLMTASRIISDRWGKTIIRFGQTHLGNDPAFNFRRLGKYEADNRPPLPVATTYAPSGPTPPLPVGTSVKALPAQTAPAAAGSAAAQPATVAAASSMGYYGRSKYGTNRFM